MKAKFSLLAWALRLKCSAVGCEIYCIMQRQSQGQSWQHCCRTRNSSLMLTPPVIFIGAVCRRLARHSHNAFRDKPSLLERAEENSHRQSSAHSITFLERRVSSLCLTPTSPRSSTLAQSWCKCYLFSHEDRRVNALRDLMTQTYPCTCIRF